MGVSISSQMMYIGDPGLPRGTDGIATVATEDISDWSSEVSDVLFAHIAEGFLAQEERERAALVRAGDPARRTVAALPAKGDKGKTKAPTAEPFAFVRPSATLEEMRHFMGRLRGVAHATGPQSFTDDLALGRRMIEALASQAVVVDGVGVRVTDVSIAPFVGEVTYIYLRL